jgi:hypothetical protein
MQLPSIFKYVTKNHPNFKNGKALKQIMFDFDDAEYNGFVEVLGKDIAEAVVQGCSVHWIRSVDRVADLVCNSQEESKIFKSFGCIIENEPEKDNVLKIFNILCGKKDISCASKYVSVPDIEGLSNEHWKKLKHWWRQDRHLQMFSKAYTLRDVQEWEQSSKTNNPVESINRQSFRSKYNLKVILENMYLHVEDRLHAVKMLATSNNVTVSYSRPQREKVTKRKCTSLVPEENQEDTAPPDKRRHIRIRKTSLKLIGSDVEVEYKEKQTNQKVRLSWMVERHKDTTSNRDTWLLSKTKKRI